MTVRELASKMNELMREGKAESPVYLSSIQYKDTLLPATVIRTNTIKSLNLDIIVLSN